jgi:carbamoyltransferase
MANHIVGISAFFHDSACCILRDGDLLAVASEERFTRQKHDASLPRHAFRYCLEQAGIGIDEVNCVAYYENPVKKLGRQLWMVNPGIPGSRLADMNWCDAKRPEREIREILGYENELRVFEHHQSHAASSFYFSGFAEASVMTVDGVGEWVTTSFCRASGEKIELLHEVAFPDSLGLLYSALTGYLGFEVNEGEYKSDGPAPYGKPCYQQEIWKLVENGRDSDFDFGWNTSISCEAIECTRKLWLTSSVNP